MANTDGFEFYIEKSKEDLAKSIVADWEKTVGVADGVSHVQSYVYQRCK